MALELRICNLGGHLCTIFVDPGGKACDVYQAVEAATEIPGHEQLLIVGTMELQRSDSLRSIFPCNEENVFDVMLIRKPDPFIRLEGFRVQGKSVHEGVMTVPEAKSKLTEDVMPNCLKQVCFAFETKAITEASMREPTLMMFYEFVDPESTNEIRFEFADPKSTDPAVDPAFHAYVRLDSEDGRCAFMSAVAKSATALLHVPQALLSDQMFMKRAVQSNAQALQYATGGLHEDPEIVLAAVKRNWFSLSCASAQLRASKDIVLAAVEQCGHALCYASDSLRVDREVVLTAVRQNGHALQCAVEELRSDPEIVLAAVRQNGHAIQYAAEELRMDETILREAIRQAGQSASRYAPKGFPHHTSGAMRNPPIAFREARSSLTHLWNIFRVEALCRSHA